MKMLISRFTFFNLEILAFTGCESTGCIVLRFNVTGHVFHFVGMFQVENIDGLRFGEHRLVVNFN